MGFRSLRVINEDRVVPGAGFPPHGHRDMEIISYVLQGALQHKDSIGNGSIIRPREVQRMSAGTGITHSEYNPSETELVHFLQIWIVPSRRGLTPGYEQRQFGESEKRGWFRLVGDPAGAEGAVTVHADARMYVLTLGAGETASYPVATGRGIWLQVASGVVALNGTEMRESDGAAVEEETELVVEAEVDAEVLLFDLA
jgi:redox-sensitive bicupin YhaK (pirin superfamily)